MLPRAPNQTPPRPASIPLPFAALEPNLPGWALPQSCPWCITRSRRLGARGFLLPRPTGRPVPGDARPPSCHPVKLPVSEQTPLLLREAKPTPETSDPLYHLLCSSSVGIGRFQRTGRCLKFSNRGRGSLKEGQ